MKDKVITFETAKLAKDKGFDKITFERKASNLELVELNNFPTQSLLQRWLREKHELNIDIGNFGIYWEVAIYTIEENMEVIHESGGYNTYEEALELGLQKGLKLINNG